METATSKPMSIPYYLLFNWSLKLAQMLQTCPQTIPVLITNKSTQVYITCCQVTTVPKHDLVISKPVPKHPLNLTQVVLNLTQTFIKQHCPIPTRFLRPRYPYSDSIPDRISLKIFAILNNFSYKEFFVKAVIFPLHSNQYKKLLWYKCMSKKFLSILI